MSDRAALHRLPLRVYFEDTDAGGVVYHANYLKFAERARTELLREVGYDHHVLRERHGVAIVVRRCLLECLLPAKLDDRLEVQTTIREMRAATVAFRQELARGPELIAVLEVQVAFVDQRGRATRIPAELRGAFTGRAGI